MELHFGVKALIVNEAGRFLAMHKKDKNHFTGASGWSYDIWRNH